MIITNWSVRRKERTDGTHYYAVSGQSIDNLGSLDGDHIKTSPIKFLTGNTIQTARSTYYLGQPQEDSSNDFTELDRLKHLQEKKLILQIPEADMPAQPFHGILEGWLPVKDGSAFTGTLHCSPDNNTGKLVVTENIVGKKGSCVVDKEGRAFALGTPDTGGLCSANKESLTTKKQELLALLPEMNTESEYVHQPWDTPVREVNRLEL